MKKDYTTVKLCDMYGSLITENQRSLIRDYYDYDMSLSEIANEHGITRQAALDSIKSGERELNRIESALKIVEGKDLIISQLTEVLRLMQEGEYSEAAEKLSQTINKELI